MNNDKIWSVFYDGKAILDTPPAWVNDADWLEQATEESCIAEQLIAMLWGLA